MANKAKTHKGAQKRIKITKTGKLLFAKAGNNHLLTNKGKNNKAHPYGKELSSTYKKKITNLFPYGK
ncbi:MAG: 50S ribosomal protein L35 [candidate division SR1 bacterium CG_4_9_14_3_um_filter_40_9]|nr:MAG: 50S ribosomal protein L35 [candidate division SR1 bacterium CG_4_9_14_3_um_filter_40_9]